MNESAMPYRRATGNEIRQYEAAYAARLPMMLKEPIGCGNRLGKPLVTVACRGLQRAAQRTRPAARHDGGRAAGAGGHPRRARGSGGERHRPERALSILLAHPFQRTGGARQLPASPRASGLCRTPVSTHGHGSDERRLSCGRCPHRDCRAAGRREPGANRRTGRLRNPTDWPSIPPSGGRIRALDSAGRTGHSPRPKRFEHRCLDIQSVRDGVNTPSRLGVVVLAVRFRQTLA